MRVLIMSYNDPEDVGETHFGGFLIKKQATSQEDNVCCYIKTEMMNLSCTTCTAVALSQEPKSRKEIMKEVVAKSKQMKVLILHYTS